MKRISVILLLVAAVVTGRLLPSCTVQPCYEETDPLMHTSLLLSGKGEPAKADSLRVYAVRGGDILKFVNARNVASFSVPLDPAADESRFIITLNGITDTALIRYERHPHLVSPACGYTFVCEISAVISTHNKIDTLLIENKSVNLDGRPNLHLFY